MTRRAILDHYDVAILWQLYTEAVPHYSITVYPPEHNVQERLYRLSRLGLVGCDSPETHEYSFLCWSISPDGERVVEISDGDYWQHKNYKFSLRRLPITTLEDDIERAQKQNKR